MDYEPSTEHDHEKPKVFSVDIHSYRSASKTSSVFTSDPPYHRKICYWDVQRNGESSIRDGMRKTRML